MSERILDLLDSIRQSRKQYFVREFEALGLGRGEGSCLLRICENPGISQENLSRLLLMDKGNLARRLSCMEEKGLVNRQVSPQDRRILELYPSEKGLDLLPRIREIRSCWDEHVLEDISPEEKERLSSMLQYIADKASEMLKNPEVSAL